MRPSRARQRAQHAGGKLHKHFSPLEQRSALAVRPLASIGSGRVLQEALPLKSATTAVRNPLQRPSGMKMSAARRSDANRCVPPGYADIVPAPLACAAGIPAHQAPCREERHWFQLRSSAQDRSAFATACRNSTESPWKLGPFLGVPVSPRFPQSAVSCVTQLYKIRTA